MIRHLPGDVLLECKGNPSHMIPWYGQSTCHCGAALPVHTPKPEPIFPSVADDPTAQYVPYLNRAMSLAQRAPGRWRLAANFHHHGVQTAIEWTGHNAARTGEPFTITIRYTLETLSATFPTRHAAFIWLIDHVSSAPLWPIWTFQQGE